MASASTASASRSDRKRCVRSRSISCRTASTLSVLPKSMYCSTRWVAVPFSAPVTGLSFFVKSGIRKLVFRGGTIGSASSSASARPFSSVAVTLDGRDTASLWG